MRRLSVRASARRVARQPCAAGLETWTAEHTEPPLPDIREVEGVVMLERELPSSIPSSVALADVGEAGARIRELRRVVRAHLRATEATAAPTGAPGPSIFSDLGRYVEFYGILAFVIIFGVIAVIQEVRRRRHRTPTRSKRKT